LFVGLSCEIYSQKDTTIYGVIIPNDFTALSDVVYKKTNNWEGKVDIYLPPNKGKKTPVVINIHGGGWNHGSKEAQKGFGSYFKNNMAVANMSYRLVDTAPAPAAIEDVRSVMIYLIRNAEELNIDVDKIVLAGGSAGGHLAMMGAYLANDSRFDVDRDGVQTVKAAAVIDKYGITDMVDFALGSNPYKSAVRWIGAKIGNKDFVQSVSPIYYVTETTPPTFVVHGDADPIVPYSQSLELVKKLNEKGVTNVFMTVEGGGHGKFDKEKNNEISAAVIKFLKEIGIIE
jgi:acetyl esterase/lipase